MGGILSGDEKILRQNAHEFSSPNNLKKNISLEDLRKYQRTNKSRNVDAYKINEKKLTFYKSNGRSVSLPPQKSQSLDTIFEELSKDETNDPKKRTKEDIQLKLHKPLIPRIKLTKRRTKTNYSDHSSAMSSESYSTQTWDKPSSVNDIMMIENKDVVDQQSITVNDLIQKNPDDNYFTKNFDECIKRLQLLEKEHQLMEEEEDSSVRLFYLEKEKNQENPEEPEPEPETVAETFNNVTSMEKNIGHLESESESSQINNLHLEKNGSPKLTCKSLKLNENSDENLTKIEESNGNEGNVTEYEKNELSDMPDDEKHELISEWYSNLKRQFEKNGDQEIKKEQTKEMSCRITGATLKNPNKTDKTDKTEDNENDTRYYFSKLMKSNKSVLDEELPDPDVVKSIRAKFQENLNSTLKKRLNGNLGGSLQNINSKKDQTQKIWRPLSVQCNRDEVIREMEKTFGENSKEKNMASTNSTESIKDSEKEPLNSSLRSRMIRKFEKELKSRDFRSGKLFASKWTDSGSVSSGVSSDLSSYDTDLEPGPEPEQDDTITLSDDDLLDEVKDKHYVQSEILEKIRSFGTSVTYYGGEMLTCSVGSLLSPTAQAIMEEITEKYKKEKNVSRTFDEFYGKYAETNDLNIKKKLGRAKSFGQTDVFHKQNTLSNTEIEMYKYDLEVEIGIRKPKGLQQTHSRLISPKSKTEKNPAKNIDEDKTPILSETKETNQDAEKEQNNCTIRIIVEESTPIVDDTFDDEAESTNDAEPVEPEAKPEAEPEAEQQTTEQSKEENVELEKETESITINNKKLNFERSQSTPHEIIDSSTSCNDETEILKASSTDNLFECDKNAINDSKNSQKEFEEFQVCENTIDKNKTQIFNEVISDPLKSSMIESQKVSENSKVLKNNNVASEENTKFAKSISSNFKHEVKFDDDENEEVNRVQSKFKKNNNLRWPIETRGVVDIQNKIQSPGIVVITNGKSPKPTTKSKIRLF